ncbi:alkaline phosphatase D family protein [Rhodocytophaga aerolata]|uniref:Alkaline phosphatase D family protein n=1 Tax=Rhodocytophaga aerolata TaxID=455078 RepID=A0ABT8R3H4_9BACT|nr:alkaline phosphatase D family protein [Rhodocytophaga aerolata]MDO1445195.1 alkaline phosphatase D family protein [Rhodocytophaga aerolata]
MYLKNLFAFSIIVVLVNACTPRLTTSSDLRTEPLTQIAFGSCSHEYDPQPLWKPILKNRPQLWMWLGDNIYGDTHDMSVMKQKYDVQKNHADYQKLAASSTIIGIWDDHDYGINDGGKAYAKKEESQQLMLDFLDVPAGSERRTRAGAYESYTYGPEGKQVKVILLDARYFRDTLMKQNKMYIPNETGTILGEAQWQWLEKELTNSKAAIHLIASGIQMIPEEHIYEKWANFPQERKRLFELISSTKAPGVILLSGDRHIAEISKYTYPGVAYPLYEVTASGLTHSATNNKGEPNRYRVGKLMNVLNFGVITIDWQQLLNVHLQIRGEKNKLLQEEKFQF